jgi:hypothetical protein
MFNKNCKFPSVLIIFVFVLAMGGFGVTPSQVHADAVEGTISGTVYEADGVTPIVNVFVAVNGNDYGANTCTDASGQFAFSNLPLDVQLQVQAAPPWANCGEWSNHVQEFWQETGSSNNANLVTLTSQDPDRIDINFTLDAGGVISGTVYASDGVTPLQHIAVSFHNEDNSYGNSVCTNADGEYAFHGAPFDIPLRVQTNAYWDPWCNAGVNVASEYWQETPDSASATLLTLTALSPTQAGIDFTLDPAGSVSGTVYESDGVTPIPNVVVSLTGNNYGAGDCTDNSGHYTIHNVPFGLAVYAKAAPNGSNWCGGSNDYLTEYWQETPNSSNATLFSVTAQAPAQMDIDFTLDVGVNFYKTLHVVPGNPEVHGHDWPPGANVTLTIDADANSGNGVLYTETKNADDEPLWCGYPCFDLNGIIILEVGQYITLTDGATSKTVHISPLTVTNLDFSADTVSGIADPGSRVAVNIWSQNGIARYVTTAVDGTWIADFSVVGDEDFEQQLADIQPGDNGRAIQLNPDDSDDGTLEYWYVPSPHLDVWYMDENINAYDWPFGTHLTLEIENPTTVLSPDYSSETDVTGYTSWDPKTTLGSFNLNGLFEITPGMIVTVSGASLTKDLEVANLSVTSIDLANDTVSGSTDPNQNMWMWFETSCCRNFQANGSGVWTVDYSVLGTGGEPVADIGLDSAGTINAYDNDGDNTSLNWNATPPTVDSITRASASLTTAASVNYTVTFSEDVQNVDVSDFTLTKSIGISGGSVSAVSGSGSTYTVTVNTGSGSGTLRLDVPVSATIQDLFNNSLGGLPFTSGESYTKVVSATYKSAAANDGWILESSETSNSGGMMNSAATTITLGDDATDKQYRAILHFDTSALPDTAVVTNMTLKIKQQGAVTGVSPFTFGSLYVDMRNPAFGGSALELTDFNFAAKKVKPAVLNPNPVSGWFSARFNTGGKLYVNRTGTTQLRLYFSVDDNNNNIADFIRFYSGNASAGDRPKLLITYYVP